MSRPELATFVHVADEQGAVHVFGPGDRVPDWAVGKIVNPKAWKGGKVPGPSESPEDELVRLQARINALKAAIGDGGAENQGDGSTDSEGHGQGEDQHGPPPKSGAGSGDKAWRAYAADRDVEVPADAKREQVWSLLAEAGVPTE
ncbi:hypothetical protein [Micromonospora sp. DT229]|uniref:hypothetical protein n=1 Tax=Micromonospora sp. DT229 TaxID=3393430 RepID=UPI003CF1802B